MQQPQHKWKRDVAIILVGLLILGLVIFVIALSQVNWNIGALIDEFEKLVRANENHLIVIELILPVIGVVAIVTRVIAHFVHKPRDEKYQAEINYLQEENTALKQTVQAKDLLLVEYQVHHS